MKNNHFQTVTALSFLVVLVSCNPSTNPVPERQSNITGTWKLISGTLIEKGDTTVTDYTGELSFIKIINDTHFAFLQHNKSKKDPASFSAGGGGYILKDSSYTEHLEYCSAPEWEGNTFQFTIHIQKDTLVQSGIEKIEGTGVNRVNIEKYVRLKQVQ